MPFGGQPRQQTQQPCFDKVKMGAMMGFSIGALIILIQF